MRYALAMVLGTSIIVAAMLLSQSTPPRADSGVVLDRPAANVIVCGIRRAFSLAEPFRPEPWWPVGAAMLRDLGRDQIVAYGKNVPALVADIERQVVAGGFAGVARVEVWTHGGPGYFRIEGRRCHFDLFDSRRAQPSDATALLKLRDLLMPNAVVHFRSCSTFHGMKGHAIAVTASRFFCATGKSITVMGHTRPTGLTHPGWKVIPPGGIPDWSLNDGEFEAEFEGVVILIRDLLRVFTAYAYDVVPMMYESNSKWPGTQR